MSYTPSFRATVGKPRGSGVTLRILCAALQPSSGRAGTGLLGFGHVRR
jgi:hypothetical protein